MFVEKDKQYHIRNSCNIKYCNFKKIINENLIVEVYYNNQQNIYKPVRKSKNALIVVKTRIIEIIELNAD